MQVNVGDVIPEWDVPRVAPERMRTMAAILRDPNPVHWDRKTVARLGRLEIDDQVPPERPHPGRINHLSRGIKPVVWILRTQAIPVLPTAAEVINFPLLGSHRLNARRV